MKTVFAVTAIALILPGAAHAASAVMKSPDGKELGTLELVQTGDGVSIKGTLSGIEPGIHAFHIHETGKCDAPDFKSAGGHFNPHGAPHGKDGGGPHAGDMENLHITDSSPQAISVVNAAVTLNPNGKTSLFDADGSAIVIHAGADDYSSQPSGAAGGRVACGVIQ